VATPETGPKTVVSTKSLSELYWMPGVVGSWAGSINLRYAPTKFPRNRTLNWMFPIPVVPLANDAFWLSDREKLIKEAWESSHDRTLKFCAC
jgi:hypothetical protein